MFKKKSFSYIIYTFCIFLVMSASGELSFTWHIPKVLSYFFAIIGSFIMLPKIRTKRKDIKLALIYFFIVIYQLLFCRIGLNVMVMLYSMTQILIIGILICLPVEIKEKVFSLLSTMFSIIIGISIVGWIIYLVGGSIPVGELYESDDQFHVLRNYYFFVRSERIIDDVVTLIPRFSGMFLEPGQLAAPCAFFFFGSTKGFKDIRNIIFLTACILSFSLSGYSLLLIGLGLFYLLPNITRSFTRIFCIISLIFVGLINLTLLSSEQDSDNPFYTFIMSRLEYDKDKGISGNNRTTSYFDIGYEKFIQSNDIYTGLQGKDPNLVDWTYNCSGYKKFIVHYGIIGLALLIVFCIQIYKINKDSKTFTFLIIMIVAFIPRAMIINFMWLIPFILGMFVLKEDSKKKMVTGKRPILSNHV